jgi:methylmalonyl-CoA mutase N-terminal domain/subunit
MKDTEASRKIETDSGIPIERVYRPRPDFDYESQLGDPGEYPYTRGIHPEMYRSRLWTMRQYTGFATARETNQRFRYLLDQGQTGLSVAFDLPTQMGYDSDHPMAEGEVGRVGVAIDSLEDMEILFDGIPLDQVSTSMTINATAAILLAFYIAVARKQGADMLKLRGTVQNDILKEYIARATYIYPPRPSMRLVTDIIEYCQEQVPQWNPISISGYHIREAGSDAVQEVAFTLANAIAYVSAALERGLDVDRFGARLSFFFAIHNNFFEEVAKLRAARRLWARIMRERFGASNPRSQLLRFHSQTAGSTLTAQQIENNVVRVTLQALAAVLGGTQSLHVNAKDEALALPTELSARTALRTQQIIAHESGVVDTADPLGGSYFVEQLTDEIEQRVQKQLDAIEAMGGAIAAIEAEYFQEQIAKRAYEYQKAIEEKTKVVVGVNAYVVEEEEQVELLKVDPQVHKEQRERLQSLKARRDNARVQRSLSRLRGAAEKETENLMPHILDCVEAYATLGEISDALRDVFGTYPESRTAA